MVSLVLNLLYFGTYLRPAARTAKRTAALRWAAVADNPRLWDLLKRYFKGSVCRAALCSVVHANRPT